MVLINNTKAIEITKDKIRAYREPKLQALDVEFTRALEQGQDTSSIVAEKQVLRDMPSTVEGKSNDELKVIIDSLGV